MRYFFPITDGFGTCHDRQGEEYPTPGAAMLAAIKIAAELGWDGGFHRPCVVAVVDQRGVEIGRVPVVLPDGAKGVGDV